MLTHSGSVVKFGRCKTPPQSRAIYLGCESHSKGTDEAKTGARSTHLESVGEKLKAFFVPIIFKSNDLNPRCASNNKRTKKQT